MRIKGAALIAATLGLAVVIISPGILAQQPDSAAAKPAEKKSDSYVSYKAKSVKSVWGDKKTIRMQGEVVFTHEDTVISSDQVDYDDVAKTALSAATIKITNPECDVTGDKGSAYFRKKLGVVEGNVVMLLKPKKEASDTSAGKDSVDKFKQDTTVTCARIEYFYGQKLASAQGNVVFKQQKRTAYADKAVYDQKAELLTLTGNAHATDEDGQTFTAPGEVKISLKKGDEWMEGSNASGKVKIDLGEENAGEKK